ncbi:MAG: hypothetical protein ACLPR9_04105 [Acidimicrobiales bacterium]
MRKRDTIVAFVVGLSVVVQAGCSSSSTATSTTATAAGPQALVGTFRLAAGASTASGATGTYFRMIQPNGTLAIGPFFDNPDSTGTDKSYTLQVPGTAGGLVTGRFQPNPSPAFDASGNALAGAIVAPTPFSAIAFGISTDATDPQSGKSVPAPGISFENGKITGQLESWTASWNKLYFNQGSPKPDGTSPGLTSPVSGTYDSATHTFVITWASEIVGGPFNGFTGYWHLQGTFAPGK